ncbi:unnamed protein product [Urochloa humidicola]
MAWPGKARSSAEALSLALLVINTLLHLSLALPLCSSRSRDKQAPDLNMEMYYPILLHPYFCSFRLQVMIALALASKCL